MPQIPQDHADTRKPEVPQPVTPEEALHAAWHNEASTKDAQGNFIDGLNNLLYHPETGFLSQQGAAALGRHQAAQQGLEKLYQSANDALGNDNRRKLFDQATRPLLDNSMGQLQCHAQGQSRVYDAQASLDCMLGLVRFIRTLRRDDLRCWTVMPDLFIASDEADVNPDSGPYLMIAPLFNGQVILRYVDGAHPEAEWRKIFTPEHAQTRLLVALDQLSQAVLA